MKLLSNYYFQRETFSMYLQLVAGNLSIPLKSKILRNICRINQDPTSYIRTQRLMKNHAYSNNYCDSTRMFLSQNTNWTITYILK